MIDCREYGSLPFRAIIVHGGPGAPGCCAGICRGLADAFGVLEHLQTKNSTDELLEELCGIAFHEEQFKSLMDEAVSMRASGELLNFSDHIKCPVIAIHGKKDPHPWRGVKEPLENRLNEFKMYVIDKCGHDPWKEYYAKDEFFAILKSEMECSVIV